jgi:Flagellar biosynthesis protein, FliO
MNGRTKEQSLEQAVTPGYELGVILAPCASPSNSIDTTQGGGDEGKGAIRHRSIRIRAEAAAKPRKATTSRKKAPGTIKSTDNCQPLKKRAAGRTKACDDTTETAGANIRIVEAELPERAWLLAGNKSTAVETRPDSNSNTSPSMRCAREAVVLERNSVDPQLAAPGSQPEGSPIERTQSGELQWGTILRWLTWAWKYTRRQLVSRQSRKRLRVCESVSLGEKRFVAVIEVDGEQFLVGGASNSVATLARLEPTQEFSEVLKRRWAPDPLHV